LVKSLPLFRDEQWDDVVDLVQRALHIEPEVVLLEATQFDAIRVKEDLECRQAKVKISRTAANPQQRRREPIPPAVRREVWRRDGGKCADCGSREKLEYDHIIPVSQGGANTVRNIELRCERCNRRKAGGI
jgi:5-methylcytosine-specific restriction endonuclease McrA